MARRSASESGCHRAGWRRGRLLPLGQPLRRLGDSLDGVDVDEGGERGMRLSPLGERRFEAPGALLGRPDRSATGVGFVGRHLDQPFALENLQIARQRRRRGPSYLMIGIGGSATPQVCSPK